MIFSSLTSTQTTRERERQGERDKGMRAGRRRVSLWIKFDSWREKKRKESWEAGTTASGKHHLKTTASLTTISMPFHELSVKERKLWYKTDSSHERKENRRSVWKRSKDSRSSMIEKEMRGPINGSSLQPLLPLLSLLFSFPLIHPRDHHQREMTKEESESEREMLRDNFWMYKSIRDWFLMEDWSEEEIKEIFPLLSSSLLFSLLMSQSIKKKKRTRKEALMVSLLISLSKFCNWLSQLSFQTK